MPTVLVLDTSPGSAMVNIGSNLTAFSVLKQAVVDFLTALSQAQMLEFVAIVTTDEPVTPGASLNNQAPGFASIIHSCSFLPSRWSPGTDPASVATQIIAFTFQLTPADILQVDLKRLVRLHAVSFFETRRAAPSFPDALSISCTQTGGFYGRVYLEDDGWMNYKSQLSSLMSYYKPYQGVLALGHLEALVSFYPTPSTALWSSLAVQNGLPQEFPSVMSLTGFIRMKCLTRPVSLCRFVFLPDPISHPSPLLALLLDTMKQRKLLGVVLLGEPAWVGLVTPHSDYRMMPIAPNSNNEAIMERSGLILSVLPRGYIQEWGGAIEFLTADGVLKETFNKNALPPNPTITFPSYLVSNKEKVMTGLPHEKIQKMLAKVSKLCKGGLASKDKLFAHCEKIRLRSKQFCMPDLVRATEDLLLKALGEIRNQAALEAVMLFELATLLRTDQPAIVVGTILEYSRASQSNVPPTAEIGHPDLK